MGLEASDEFSARPRSGLAVRHGVVAALSLHSQANQALPNQAYQASRVAVLLPCRNEGSTIANVVADFKKALPHASVYVYDNASTDQTAMLAQRAGATVGHVSSRGKGNVMRRMFANIDADVYVMADGDGTYDASIAPALVTMLLAHNYDMVVGRRVADERLGPVYRHGHRLGNRLFTTTVRWAFGNSPQDVLSGYRVFSRRYVRSFPAMSRGFEIEAELTVHALELGAPFGELPTPYRARPAASVSKLRTVPDGLRILGNVLILCKEYRPVRFFGAIMGVLAVVAALAAFVLPWRAVGDPATGHAVVVACLALIGVFSVTGLILDSLSRTRREMKRVLYLAAADRFPVSGSAPTSS